MVGDVTLYCVNTFRGEVRRIISLRYANRKERDVYRAIRADIDKANLLAELAAKPRPGEEEIEAQVMEDGDAWTDEELDDAELVYPPPSAD